MRVLQGVFDSVEAAERAREYITAAGVPAERIRLSRSLTEDGIAGEAPGQSYENQPGQVPGNGEDARFAERARSRVCVLSVSAPEGEQAWLEDLMRRIGASRLG